jgi:hypothetical protein
MTSQQLADELLRQYQEERRSRELLQALERRTFPVPTAISIKREESKVTVFNTSLSE